ncbi:MAG: universal stress protein [Alphaproteobacteria bacterium]|nr:universal stress protein [Alphaproteobacteria bacterium]MBV9694372.1 universal stress protein [Alphaproteobacteria bacterium]
MSFVKILAPLTGGPDDRATLASALSAALPFGAHVTGIFVRSDPALAMPFHADGVSSAVMQEIVDSARGAGDGAAAAARQAVETLAREAGVALVAGAEKHEAPTLAFAEVAGHFAGGVARAALLGDLVVFVAQHPEERIGVWEAIDAVLLEARRPVLLSAKPVPPDFWHRIVVAWNASAACAQAVSAALPLLKRADFVEVLCVAAAEAPAPDASDLVDYLALRGVQARKRDIQAGTRAVADALFDAAQEARAGLMVLGSHGHSRWRDLFATSTTRQAMRHPEVPLLLMH